MSDWRPTASLAILRQRAAMLQRIRTYFDGQDVLEVETPALSNAAISDPSIQSIEAATDQQKYYLHSSPELAMKRLLAAGYGDIYQIAKVFRAGEAGRYHNLEFTMLEWYRLGWDDAKLQIETVELIQALAKASTPKVSLTIQRQTYSDAFLASLNCDPLEATVAELQGLAASKSVHPHCDLSRDGWLDLLFSTCVMTQFKSDHLNIIYDYPSSQAALSRLNPDGKTAARFEVFWGQVELANGYHELSDPKEQRKRFEQDQFLRSQAGIPEVPVDEHFLSALEAGMPNCAGVALGLDRLLMKLTGEEHIDQVLTFPARTA